MNIVKEKLVPLTYVRLNVKTFSNDTTVHGFKELYYSKKIVWKSIWFVILSMAMGLTGYQICTSVQQYVDQPTVTNILPLDDGQLLYPPFSICYTHWSSWVDWKKLRSLNISKSVLYFGLSYLDKVFSQEVFDMNSTEENFQITMARNNWTHLSEFYSAIAEDYPTTLSPENDVFKSAFTDRGFYYVMDMSPFCYTISSQYLKTKINRLSSNFRKSSAKIINLSIEKYPIPTFNEYLSAQEYVNSIQYVLQDDYTFTTTMTSADISKMYNPHIILPNLSFQPIDVNSDVDTYRIKLRASVHKWQCKSMAHCIAGQVTNSANDSCQTVCDATLYSKMCETIPFQVAFPLQTDTPLMTCRRNITFTSSVERVRRNSSTLEELMGDCLCTEDVPKEHELESRSCIRKCTDGCEKWDFDVSVSFTMEQSSLKDFANRQYVRIEIEYPSEESVLVISEINSQSWESFVANVGGLLGIWLGASIVSFIQTIYLCCFSEPEEPEPTFYKVASSKLEMFNTDGNSGCTLT